MKPQLILFLLLTCLGAAAQPEINSKKYPSLLWEISKPGQKKPSYLIGTMHVSNKMAFNLPDSFYHAIRSANVVALETNPETWQEDMSRYDIGNSTYGSAGSLYGAYSAIPADYLGINTLKFYRYNRKIERALYSNPSAINNLLYRTYGNESSDFEEDTYLDMYIFQCGKKWGKTVTGVEDYGESMRLMAEAYKDAGKDKSKKERSYGDWDEAYSTDKLQEAYRRGNLDLLDTINKYNSFSAAFDEKFLYKRNEIQAQSIDSIIRSGATLFVGVGAAHLPGDRGVIEILRRLGYRLRPVKMGERASREKDQIDRIRVPVNFRTDSSEDGFYKVEIPGKFYKYGDDAALDQKQCADMANGSYYLVTRIMTNAWMWNHGPDDVYRVVDSLLYENVPGKIISKAAVTKNGYKGFDVLNRTRRGDLQRYQIYITPFEILFFKMSGNADYVKNGPEADRFFSSIRFKEYKNGNGTNPVKYSPSYGGFAIQLPHEPYIGNDGSWIYDAADKSNGIHYRVIRTDVHNFNFAGEDSFDLALMEESFKASEFIDSQLYRRFILHQGYPALEAAYRDKKGAQYLTRFIIQGAHYYSLIARGKQSLPAMTHFVQSFELKPFQYGTSKNYRDSLLYYSVNSSWYPEEKKIKLDIPQNTWYGSADQDDEKTEKEILESGVFRNKVIRNDSTGERIYVSFFRSSKYHYIKDSSIFGKETNMSFFADTSFRYLYKKKTVGPDGTKIWDALITDTGSSRTLRTKMIYRDGNGYALAMQGDTLTEASSFTKFFFDTFTPDPSLKSTKPFEKKSTVFFRDLQDADSVIRNNAISQITEIDIDSTDLLRLQKAVASLNWKEKKYLETKKELINRFGDIKTRAASDYLRELYVALDDTIQLQYTVLENLLQQKTAYAYRLFSEILRNEAPVLDFAGEDFSYGDYSIKSLLDRYKSGERIKNGKFLDELDDSMALTRTILPDLLPLLNLDDYKSSLMSLLGNMVDSNLLQPVDYEAYFSKFLVEAKQELKKQAIAEKRKAIEKAEESKIEKTKASYLDASDKDDGNDDLGLYAKLLLPFMESQAALVNPVIQQMLRSGDKRLRYNTFIQLVQKGKSYPDSLLRYFAGLDEYRYELYKDLQQVKKQKLFPAAFNNHLDLGRSALLETKDYEKPDSLVFIQSLPALVNEKKGLVYFYKYKTKKDDLAWKLAVVGLLPENAAQFEFEKTTQGKSLPDINTEYEANEEEWNFTSFTYTKIKEGTPLAELISKELKKLLYSLRNSGKAFFKEEDNETEEEF